MKRILFIAAIASICCAASCNSGGEEENNSAINEETTEPKNEALKGMIMVSLLKHGLPIWVTVPDTLSAHLDVTVSDWGQVEIRSGNNFQMSIADGGDIKLK